MKGTDDVVEVFLQKLRDLRTPSVRFNVHSVNDILVSLCIKSVSEESAKDIQPSLRSIFMSYLMTNSLDKKGRLLVLGKLL